MRAERERERERGEWELERDAARRTEAGLAARLEEALQDRAVMQVPWSAHPHTPCRSRHLQGKNQKGESTLREERASLKHRL
jgi:hypothetical protein